MNIPGTQGYAEKAQLLIERYESVAFVDKHRAILHVLPEAPSHIADIGAGTGADAAWFAAHGHQVLAVEPTATLREAGRTLHASEAIEWLDYALPDLALLRARRRRFDVVLLSAVWMHLDATERRSAMPAVASLVVPEGVLVLSLRHGPVPEGRRMFAVSAEETISLAQMSGLRPLLNVHAPSVQAFNRDQGVTWTQLAFGLKARD